MKTIFASKIASGSITKHLAINYFDTRHLNINHYKIAQRVNVAYVDHHSIFTCLLFLVKRIVDVNENEQGNDERRDATDP